MYKKLLMLCATLWIASGAAALDVNQASEAELDGIKGLGPATTRHILAEREKARFTDWGDFIRRVKGMGGNNAIKYSTAGMTVSGQAFEGSQAGKPKH